MAKRRLTQLCKNLNKFQHVETGFNLFKLVKIFKF